MYAVHTVIAARKTVQLAEDRTLIEDGKPKGVAIAASLVGSYTIGVCVNECKVQIWKEQVCAKTENVGDWKKPVQ